MDARLRKLYQVWNKKLKRSGFTDIETGYHIHPWLDLRERVMFQPGLKESVEAYFNWASSMLHAGKFKRARHRKIWELHANGATGSEIGKRFRIGSRRANRLVETIREYLKEKKP